MVHWYESDTFIVAILLVCIIIIAHILAYHCIVPNSCMFFHIADLHCGHCQVDGYMPTKASNAVCNSRPTPRPIKTNFPAICFSSDGFAATSLISKISVTPWTTNSAPPSTLKNPFVRKISRLSIASPPGRRDSHNKVCRNDSTFSC